MSQHHQSGASGSGRRQPAGLEFPTASYLPEEVRRQIVQRLNRTLADATVLMTHAKFAHWNVKGMSFYGLHQLFDDVAEDLERHVDLLAERITALGGQAHGTAGMAVSNCRLPAMPTYAVSGIEYVDVLTERLAIHDANLDADIREANRLEDLDTADLLNEISRDISTDLWFVEAHRQTRPIGSAGMAATQGVQASPGQQPVATAGQAQQSSGTQQPAQASGQFQGPTASTQGQPDQTPTQGATSPTGASVDTPGGEPDPTQIQEPEQVPTPGTH